MRVVVKNKCRLIFIDEVSFNPRHVKNYSWVSKDHDSKIIAHQIGTCSTAICALTDQGVLYSELRNGMNSAREFVLFLIELEKKLHEKEGKEWNRYRKKLIVVLDNATIHLTEQVRGFFRV